MIIDFFKNLKTHPQIISLSPHCYSPGNLVPGSWFLWPGFKYPALGLVTTPSPAADGQLWRMGRGQWAPGLKPASRAHSPYFPNKHICGKWLQFRAGVCVMRERCDPALGPGNYNIIRLWTLSRSAHLVTPYPRKLVQLPDSAKSWETNKTQIRPRRGRVYNALHGIVNTAMK